MSKEERMDGATLAESWAADLQPESPYFTRFQAKRTITLTPPSTPIKRKRKGNDPKSKLDDGEEGASEAVTPKRRRAKAVTDNAAAVVKPPLPTPAPTPKRVRVIKRKVVRKEDGVVEAKLTVEIDWAVSPKELHARLLAAKPTLIQERVAHDPWRIIVAVTLLNKTGWWAAVPVFWKIMEQWPTAADLAKVPIPELTALLQPLGLQNVRAVRLLTFSQQYIDSPPSTSRLYPLRTDKTYPPTEIAHYVGIGRYAVDSWRIYSPMLKGGGAPKGAQEILDRLERGESRTSSSEDDMEDAEWKAVRPLDKELRVYLIWRWAVEGYRYCPERGVLGPVDNAYIASFLSSAG